MEGSETGWNFFEIQGVEKNWVTVLTGICLSTDLRIVTDL